MCTPQSRTHSAAPCLLKLSHSADNSHIDIQAYALFVYFPIVLTSLQGSVHPLMMMMKMMR